MADTPHDDQSRKEDEIEITLEPASSADPSGTIHTELFETESMAVVSSKLHIADAYLKLAAKDYKFNDFARELLMVAMKVIKSEAGSLFELDSTRKALFIRSAVGTSSDKISSFTVPVGAGIVGHVAESRQPLVVSDTKDNGIHLK